MKLNFTHILADLGFVGVYPIYWNKESKHAIRYTYSKYACIKLSRTKGDTIWTKHQVNHESTHKCDTIKVVQIISKNQINTRLIPKFNK